MLTNSHANLFWRLQATQFQRSSNSKSFYTPWVKKNQDTKLLPNTSPNVHRFSKFFHRQTQWEICNTHTHRFNGPFFPGLPGWANTRKVKPIWILLKQEAVSGSGISQAICKSTPCSRQITMPAPHYSVFYRPDALPAAQPTASKHWRQRNHI